jgi:hypothetical protein
MTETPHTATRTPAIALTALAVVIMLTLASPLGWNYLIPQLATVPATTWQTLTAGASWAWNNAVAPVLAFLGSVLA